MIYFWDYDIPRYSKGQGGGEYIIISGGDWKVRICTHMAEGKNLIF